MPATDTTERLDETLAVPLTRSMKKEITDLAEVEERKPATMARLLWREALNARRRRPRRRPVRSE